MQYTFVVETGQPDGNGDIILLDGLKLPSKVIVTDNFQRDRPPLTVAHVNKDGDTLKATAEIPDEYLDHYPAIGFLIKKYSTTEKGKVWEETELKEIGLSEKPNANPDIKTIREQNGGK